VASSAWPESAHPPILLPRHFQENPSRLRAWLINPKEMAGGRERCADLAAIVLSAGSSGARCVHCNTDNPPTAPLNPIHLRFSLVCLLNADIKIKIKAASLLEDDAHCLFVI